MGSAPRRPVTPPAAAFPARRSTARPARGRRGQAPRRVPWRLAPRAGATSRRALCGLSRRAARRSQRSADAASRRDRCGVAPQHPAMRVRSPSAAAAGRSDHRHDASPQRRRQLAPGAHDVRQLRIADDRGRSRFRRSTAVASAVGRRRVVASRACFSTYGFRVQPVTLEVEGSSPFTLAIGIRRGGAPACAATQRWPRESARRLCAWASGEAACRDNCGWPKSFTCQMSRK